MGVSSAGAALPRWAQGRRRTTRSVLAGVLTLMLAATGLAVTTTPAAAAGVPAGFTDTVVASGLTLPTNVAFAPDGRFFVAEKSGLVKVFSGIGDTTAEVVADLRTQTFNYSDAGMNGLTVDPAFPTRPYLYVTYTHDALPGGTAPRWGRAGATDDSCGAPDGQCVVTGRLSRLTLANNRMTAMTTLLDDSCVAGNAHAINDVRFGPDDALYVTAGDGASASGTDYGQKGNPCGDPPVAKGTNQTAASSQGGALRAQDARTTADPMGLNGTLSRIDPDTGLGLASNPHAASADKNLRRVIATGLRNPFRFDFRPGSQEVYLGDVGWLTWDEIDVVADVDDKVVENFGWPCYEGTGRQPQWDGINNTVCETLYSQGGVTAPFYTYRQSEKFLPGGDCPSLTAASNGGVAFYRGGSYPDAYDNALFFMDYPRSCLMVMRAGADGRPDRSTLAEFSTQVPNPVDLEVGPGGDLFYVDIVGGALHRISYGAGNQAPTAVATATPSSGPVGTTVAFDGRGSRDPESGALGYAWDLDGDGAYDDSASATPTWRYTAKARLAVKLRVTDPAGATGTTTVTVDIGTSAPTPTITVGPASAAWQTGEVLTVSGAAEDPEDGALPATRLSWQVTLQHCETGGGCHAHPLTGANGVAGLSFTAPDHEYPAYLDVALTATDADGLSTTVTRRLDPTTTRLTLATQPAGLQVGVDGELVTTPVTRTVIVGSTLTVSAPAQTSGSSSYSFASWSDGGAASHEVTGAAVDASLTATYRPAAATAYRRVNVGGEAVVIDGAPWTSGTAAGLTHNGRTFSAPGVTLTPTTTPERASMIRSSAYNSAGLRLSLPSVTNGSYDTYVTTWEDNASVTYDLGLEGAVVVRGARSGAAGTWVRQGPFRVQVADGRLDLTTAGGALNISGIELWSVGTPPPPPPPPTPGAAKRVNIGGGAAVIDGQQWLAGTAAGVTHNGTTLATPTITLTPTTTPERASMVRDFVYYRWGLRLRVPAVANGAYDVYVTTFEDSSPIVFDLGLEGAVVVRDGTGGPGGSWVRRGPFPVQVADGALDLTTAKASLNISGVELVPR